MLLESPYMVDQLAHVIYKLSPNTKIHSHKKWKDSLETRAALLIFLTELEISGVVVQRIHQNSEK